MDAQPVNPDDDAKSKAASELVELKQQHENKNIYVYDKGRIIELLCLYCWKEN